MRDEERRVGLTLDDDGDVPGDGVLAVAVVSQALVTPGLLPLHLLQPEDRRLLHHLPPAPRPPQDRLGGPPDQGAGDGQGVALLDSDHSAGGCEDLRFD